MIKLDAGSGAKSVFLGRRDGIEEQCEFPTEAAAGTHGAAVHDDGFQAHEPVTTGGGQMDAEGE